MGGDVRVSIYVDYEGEFDISYEIDADGDVSFNICGDVRLHGEPEALTHLAEKLIEARDAGRAAVAELRRKHARRVDHQTN